MINAETTSPRSPTAFARLVISCAQLPAFNPIQFTSTMPVNAQAATNVTWDPRTGNKATANSPNATARVASATDCITQSQQPTMNPTRSPKARREYTYQPPSRGSMAPSSVTETAQSKA